MNSSKLRETLYCKRENKKGIIENCKCLLKILSLESAIHISYD